MARQLASSRPASSLRGIGPITTHTQGFLSKMLNNIKLTYRLVAVMLLIGIIPMWVVAWVSLQSASDSIEAEAFAKLEATREFKGNAVNRYFDTSLKIINAIARQPEVIKAAGDFRGAFSTYLGDAGLTEVELGSYRVELSQYYNSEFGKVYEERNGHSADTAGLLADISPTAVALQHAYIFANPNSLGNKHELTSNQGETPYDQLHGQHHPVFRNLLEEFGYYDIFLVDPDSGAIVYSVFKELDYATSLTTGPYAKTNFARAFSMARDSNQTTTVDFERYGPSYEAPASFQAAPIVQNGEVISILIFQLPIEPINAIMAERSGMGKTGETYLIGSDYLMRSDSYLAPETHSVAASFANPEVGVVKTEAAKAALAGKRDTKIIIDYNGNPVLSSYAPVNIMGLKWAILAEIDEAEAFAPVADLQNFVIGLGVASVFVTLMVAFLLARSIANPILEIGALVKRVGQAGDFGQRSPIKSDDEVGEMSKAFNQLLDSLDTALTATNKTLNAVAAGNFNTQVEGIFSGDIARLQQGVNSTVEELAQANEETKRQARLASEQAEYADKQAQIAEEKSAEAEKLAAEAQAIADESARIAAALKVCQANVMMADADLNIVYMNDSIAKMLAHREAELRGQLPNFEVSKLMGTCVDVFHARASHQRDMLERLKETHITDISVGELTFGLTATPVFDQAGDRLGTVVEWEDKTEQLAAAAEAKRIADENARVRQALDNVATATMIANADLEIIYSNEAAQSLMRNAELDLRQDLPRFEASKVIGSSIDIFHRDPSHQRGILANLTGTISSEFKVGGRTLGVVANPISTNGERIGTVVEWSDRTAEVAIENEIAALVQAANAGDFSIQLSEADKSGFFLALSQGLNALTTTANDGLNDVLRVLNAMAQGNLTQKIDREYQGIFDALKQSTNTTIDKLLEVITNIRSASTTLSSGAAEIATGNADLSKRTEEQASSLEETASSMEQMTSVVKQGAENAGNANDLAQTATSKATEGGVVVQRAVAAMEEINKSSKEIADIIGVIEEIAFQTNLLALNAAVEAARAGEQGRGFAVVAGEVRNLAGRSADASKDIKDLIRNSEAKVAEGSTLVNESGKTLGDIEQAVNEVSVMIAEIAAGSKEQTAGISQVNTAISQMDEMTQQNAALVEQATASSETVAEQATGLARLMDFFNTGESAIGNKVAKPSSITTRQKAKDTDAEDDDWQEF